jgi:predicted N-acyltransferase
MRISRTDNLASVPATEWNALEGGLDNPFVRHEFLSGLEAHGCVGEKWGWLPTHLLAHEGERLVGAVPLYIKYNSYGEFVFDWSWADAYRRAGLPYYPKLVVGVPYTPAPGPRILLADDAPEGTADALVEAALELAREMEVSSLHWLFTGERDTGILHSHGLMRRTGTQFHWFNQDYRDFDDYLDQFTAQKRKKLKRERRRVQESGVELEVLNGREISEAQWDTFHRFYEDTFDKRGGSATLTGDFFKHLGESMPERVVLVLARYEGRYVAGAFNLRSDTARYGRHWGCDREFHSLHFEACYYQGLDYCIRHGLKRFEPGAQGEHKVGRGFVPVPTWSAHWLANPVFSRAVADVLEHEHEAMLEYMAELREHLPFKEGVHIEPGVE